LTFEKWTFRIDQAVREDDRMTSHYVASVCQYDVKTGMNYL